MSKTALSLTDLFRGNASDKEKERATRLIDSGTEASRRYVDESKDEVRKIEIEIDTLMDISASTDANAGITAITLDQVGERVKKYHALRLKLETTKLKLQVAEKVHEELSAKPETKSAAALNS